MQKKYTKHQIVEAIKHWESLLKRMDEKQQTLMSRLVKVFGEDLVKNQHVNLSQSQVEQLYKILNNFVFDNILDDIPVKLMDIDNIIEELHRQDEVENIPYQDYSSKKKSYGFYINVGDVDESLSDNKQIFSLKYRNHMIYINQSKCNGLSFLKQVAVLCHEMIHYYDALYGQYKKFHQISYLQKREKNDHLTPTFKQKKKDARTMEIPVSSFIVNFWENLSDEEFMKVIEQLDESELSSPPFSELQSTECTKVGKKCIKFMSYGQL